MVILFLFIEHLKKLDKDLYSTVTESVYHVIKCMQFACVEWYNFLSLESWIYIYQRFNKIYIFFEKMQIIKIDNNAYNFVKL